MLYIKEKIKNLLKNKKLSVSDLSKMIGKKDSSPLNRMISGKISFSKNALPKVAKVLEIAPDEIRGWILADKCSKELLLLALKSKENPPKNIIIAEKKKKRQKYSIFRNEIDARRIEKRLSRTQLIEKIDENQADVNKMIIGDKVLSPKVKEKLAKFFDLPEIQLEAWKLADKYSLEALRTAVETLEESAEEII